jgi:hypothetical protein
MTAESMIKPEIAVHLGTLQYRPISYRSNFYVLNKKEWQHQHDK